MISIPQLRAARALLDWKQSDLAKATGLSLTALSNIEREVVSPRASTALLIQAAFERSGVEFTESDGVRMRADKFNVRTFEGKKCIEIMLDDVIQTLRASGGEAIWGGTDESFFVENYRNLCFDFYTSMLEYGLKERAFCIEGNRKIYAPRKVTQYRALPKGSFGLTNYGVYGDKYALLTSGKKDRLVVIEHEGVAEIHRQLFENQWKDARYVAYTKSLYDEDLEKLK